MPVASLQWLQLYIITGLVTRSSAVTIFNSREVGGRDSLMSLLHHVRQKHECLAFEDATEYQGFVEGVWRPFCFSCGCGDGVTAAFHDTECNKRICLKDTRIHARKQRNIPNGRADQWKFLIVNYSYKCMRRIITECQQWKIWSSKLLKPWDVSITLRFEEVIDSSRKSGMLVAHCESGRSKKWKNLHENFAEVALPEWLHE